MQSSPPTPFPPPPAPAMKFAPQPQTPTSPISPQSSSSTFPVHDAVSPSPLAALIPTFLRRPTARTTNPDASRSRSSSSAYRSTPSSSTSSTTASTRTSSEDLGLLDDDPFACSWTTPQQDHSLPAYSLPNSPPSSPRTGHFSFDISQSHTYQFPTLIDRNPDILPLHRRERAFSTLKAHPRNATWLSDRPAFRKRPSLPPLSILAQQNVVVVAPKSSRARQFPSEPWDRDASELPPLPSKLSPIASAEDATPLASQGEHKDLPPLPEGPWHPSPIAELEEPDDNDFATATRRSVAQWQEAQKEEPTTPENGPMDEDMFSETTPRPGSASSAVRRSFLTTSVAIAVSHVQDSHKDVLHTSSRRPNTQFDTSPAPSSCLLPSPLPGAHMLPELSPRTSSTGSTDSTDPESKTSRTSEEEEEHLTIWNTPSDDLGRSPASRRHASCDGYWPTFLAPTYRRSFGVDNTFRTLFNPPPGKRSLSFSATQGEISPFDHMISGSRAQSYAQNFSRPNRMSADGSGGGGGGGRDGRDGPTRRPNGGGSGAGGSGRGDGGDDGRRSNPTQTAVVAEEEAQSEDEDDDTRYGQPDKSTLRVPPIPPTRRSNSARSRVAPTASSLPRVSSDTTATSSQAQRSETSRVSPSSSGGSSSDDVPLAQRLPTALTAQKSIRKKARDDKARRTASATPAEKSGLTSLNTEGGDLPDELMSKLLQVQMSSSDRGRELHPSPLPSQGHPSPNTKRAEELPQPASVKASASIRRPQKEEQPAPAPAPRRRMISFGSRSRDEKRPAPLDVNAHPLPNRRESGSSESHSPKGLQLFSFPHSRESSGRSMQPAAAATPPPPILEKSQSRSRAMTMTGSGQRASEDALRRARSTREGPSHDERALPPVPGSSRSRVHSGGHPITPAPAPGDVQQQRIFITDLQRFVNVEINANTTAEDVIEVIAAQGELRGRDWMLWELANEFGMERPIRDYERLADVFSSWNKEARVNALMLKQTPLALALSRRALPNKAPVFGGYVQWEVKRGKWSKRWLELREHSLFLSKKENAKDETLLCTLSTFDAYVVKRIHKAPKAFVFAVKSSDNISMFENPADSFHVFSCDPEEGNNWLERILVARSYVLYQERNVLFRTQRVVDSTANAGLQRGNTRRTPARPLIADPIAPPSPSIPFPSQHHNPNGAIFAEGSLLARAN